MTSMCYYYVDKKLKHTSVKIVTNVTYSIILKLKKKNDKTKNFQLKLNLFFDLDSGRRGNICIASTRYSREKNSCDT